jgi:hypothetical protein
MVTDDSEDAAYVSTAAVFPAINKRNSETGIHQNVG